MEIHISLSGNFLLAIQYRLTTLCELSVPADQLGLLDCCGHIEVCMGLVHGRPDQVNALAYRLKYDIQACVTQMRVNEKITPV